MDGKACLFNNASPAFLLYSPEGYIDKRAEGAAGWRKNHVNLKIVSAGKSTLFRLCWISFPLLLCPFPVLEWMKSAVKLFYHIGQIVPCGSPSFPANIRDDQLKITFVLSKVGAVKMFLCHLGFLFSKQYSIDVLDDKSIYVFPIINITINHIYDCWKYFRCF